MNKRRERTLQDLRDATPNLSQPQVTPILKGNFRMQGPVDEACSDLPTHMVAPEISKGFSSCSDRTPRIDYREKPGKCNVCSAPCSSCFHVNKALMNPGDESAGETCAENIVACGKCEIVQPTSDSVSENVVGKASSRTSDATASDDNVVYSKSEGRSVSERHDDCLSCVSGTEEQLYNKSDSKDSRLKYNEQSNFSGEHSEKMPRFNSTAELYSQNSVLVEIPNSKTSNDAADTEKVHNTYSDDSNAEYLSRDHNPINNKVGRHSHMKDGPLGASTEQMDSLQPRDVPSDVVCCDPLVTALKSAERSEDMDVEIHATNETDDSDMVEQDVKVCDICGDAGREDLLAICSRCIDGAEHTYCMRVMLTEVPEGQWLCEECKSVERVENETQEKIQRVDENEKNNMSGQPSTEYANSSDVEEQRAKGYAKVRGKRPRDDVDTEVSSIVKKPTLESIGGSPKSSTSSKAAALSRQDSLKIPDKGRMQSSGHPSSQTFPVNDTPESALSASNSRVQKFRGTFSKSHSFNSLNSKPKVKLVDQDVIPKQKSVRERASFPLERLARSVGKSLSFKSTNSSRSESKMKMLSPRLSHTLDTKHAKQRTTLQRQQSSKIEYPSRNSITGTPMSSASKIDKRPAPRGESSSLIPIANHHGVKPIQAANKSATLSRSSSLAARRSADLSSSPGPGEFKRPSTHGQNTRGVSFVNEVNIIDKKSKRSSLKQDSSSSAIAAERPPFSANEGSNDGFHRPRESTDSGEQVFSGSRFAQPFVRSSRDESNNLKAAIEAAVLRKPGVNKKHKPFGQSDDSSMTRAGCEVPSMTRVGCEVAPHRDHVSSSSGKKQLYFDAELSQRPTISHGLTADSHGQETANNVQQFPLVPEGGFSSGGRDGAVVAPSTRDIFSSVPETIPFILQSLAIPEHEYLWQGSFEVCRSGNIVDLWDGIQAHLSTCASPRVIEATNKFKSRIVLHEVPRLSTWPSQFQESGARDDNIALFFFAKDTESYEKIYKVLLDNMIKNDLALKGNANGVELLIFPSNHLPDNSQRWNNLFFLWGVFRGKKESCFPPIPANRVSDPQDIPPAIISLPEHRCSHRPITEDFHVSGDAARVLEVPASEDLCSLLSSGAVSVDCSAKLSAVNQLGNGLHSTSSVAVKSDSPKQCLEIKDACQDANLSSSCSHLQVMGSSSYSGRKLMLIDLETPPLDGEQSLHNLNASAAGTSNMAPQEGIGEETVLNRTNHHHKELTVDVEYQSMDVESLLKEDRGTQDLNVEQSRCLLNYTEGLHADLCVVPQTPYPVAGQVLLSNGRSDEACGALVKINRIPSSTLMLQDQWQEACSNTVIPYSDENSERRFFPVESQPAAGLPFVHGSMPWKKHGLEQDQVHDIAPNLELALGAEIKPTTQAIQPWLDRRMSEENSLQQARTNEEDDVTATSLSLSLSFPFPQKEESTKPGPRTERLVSES